MELPPGVLDLLKLGLMALVGRGVCALLPAGRPAVGEDTELPTLWAIWFAVGSYVLQSGLTVMQVTHRGTPFMYLLVGVTYGVILVWIVLTGPAIKERLPKPDAQPPMADRSRWAQHIVHVTRIAAGIGFAWMLVHDYVDISIMTLVVTALLLEGLTILRVHANARAIALPLILGAIAVDQGVLALVPHAAISESYGISGIRSVPIGDLIGPKHLLLVVSGLAWLRSGDRRGLTIFMIVLLGLLIGVMPFALLILSIFALAGQTTKNQAVRKSFGRFILITCAVALIAFGPDWFAEIQYLLSDPDPLPVLSSDGPGQGIGAMLYGDLGERIALKQRDYRIVASAFAVAGGLLVLRSMLTGVRFNRASCIWLIVLPLIALVLDPAGGLPWLGEERSGMFLTTASPAIALLALWVLLPRDQPTELPEIEPEISD
jgi:hypothetical protein